MVYQNSQNKEVVGKGHDGKKLEGKAAEVKAALNLMWDKVTEKLTKENTAGEDPDLGATGKSLAEETNIVIKEKLPNTDERVRDIIMRWKDLKNEVTAEIQKNEPEQTQAKRTRVVTNFVRKITDQVLEYENPEESSAA